MALPTTGDLGSLDYAFDGAPFNEGAGSASVNLGTMDYAFDASPFVGNPATFSLVLNYTVSTSLVTTKSPSNISFPVTSTVSVSKAIAKTISYVVATSLNVDSNAPDRDFFVTTSLGVVKNISITKSFTVTTSLSSTESSLIHYNNSFTARLDIPQLFDLPYSSRLGVRASSTDSFTAQLSVMEFDLAPVTDVFSLSNPFQPAIIVNGAYITSFTAPVIADPTQYSLFINLQNYGVTGASVCSLENFGFTLDDNGGNWFLTAPDNLYSCFSPVNIFGFDGTVTGLGVELTSNTAGHTYSGNFVSSVLNENMEYIFLNNPIFNKLLSSQNLTPNESSVWATARSAAQQIASQAGVSLQWMIPDMPLPGFKPQEGTTGLAALASLAQQAGGKLRWNGKTKFKVVFPDFSEGVWSIGACDLILSPVKCETYCDLARGMSYSSSSIANLPGMIRSQMSQLDAGKKILPTDKNTGGPQVQLLTKVVGGSGMGTEDPPLIFDLPYNYDQVYIQTLVQDGKDTGGANLIAIQNFVTDDPSQFFNFTDAAYLAHPYVFITNIGGVQQPQTKLDYRVLPVEGSNAVIEAKNFVTSVYYTTKTIGSPDNNNEKANLAGQLKYSFYKTNSCTFSTTFFGSLPLPGMRVSGTISDVKLYIPDGAGGFTTKVIGDINLTGIVDSVTFAWPGVVTVTASNWRRLVIYNTVQDGSIPPA